MKAVKANVSCGLPLGAHVRVADNSGAKEVKIISVIGKRSTKGRLLSAGVADLVVASVTKGKPELRHTLVKAVVVRQKQGFKRPDGRVYKFESNAVVLLKDVKSGSPQASMIKGAVAKEAAERWAGLAKLASIIV